MIEIAAAAGIPFTPDADVMREDEVAQAEKMLIDFKVNIQLLLLLLLFTQRSCRDKSFGIVWRGSY